MSSQRAGAVVRIARLRIVIAHRQMLPSESQTIDSNNPANPFLTFIRRQRLQDATLLNCALV